jgi:hypothetical protein
MQRNEEGQAGLAQSKFLLSKRWQLQQGGAKVNGNLAGTRNGSMTAERGKWLMVDADDQHTQARPDRR